MFKKQILLEVGRKYLSRGNRKNPPEERTIISYHPLTLDPFKDDTGRYYMFDGRFVSTTKTKDDLVEIIE